MPEKKYVQLRTNIALIGTVSKVFYSYNQKAKDEGWAPQLKLVGEWEGESKSDVYVPLHLADEMFKAGFLKIETGPDHDLYHILMPNTQIRLLKEEDGTKKLTRFSIVDGPLVALHKASQMPQEPPEGTKPEPVKGKAKSKLKSVVGDVKRFHLGCMALSAHNHVLLYTCPTESLDMNAVHAGAFTIMKRLEEHGVVTFTEDYVDDIREVLSDASFEARKTSDYTDFPSAEAGDIEEQP